MAKTIEEYDFSFHPHPDKKSVMEIFDMTFLSRQNNRDLPRAAGR